MSLITVAEVKALGNIDYDADDTLLSTLIESVESFVEEYCNIKLSSDDYEERLDGDGRQLWPNNLPLTAVSSVVDVWDDEETIAATEYFYTDTRIIPNETGVWADGELRYLVSYTAGYTDVTAPKGLKIGMLGLVIRAYHNIKASKKDQSYNTISTDWQSLYEKNDITFNLDKFSLERYID